MAALDFLATHPAARKAGMTHWRGLSSGSRHRLVFFGAGTSHQSLPPLHLVQLHYAKQQRCTNQISIYILLWLHVAASAAICPTI